MALHNDVAAQHRVGRDARVAVDLGVVADQRRPRHVVERVDVDVLADPDVLAEADAGDVGLDLAVEHVAVGGQILLQVTDVLPVAVDDGAVERLAELEELGEELLAEVVLLPRRDVLEDLGLEHVDAGVDRVGEDLPPRRLLEEALDAPLVVDDDHPEVERVLDAFEGDGHHGATTLVLVDDGAEVEVGEGVARDDDERLPQLGFGVLDAPRRAQRLLLDRVAQVDTQRLAVAEVAADDLG